MLLQDAICTHRHTFVVECVAVSFTVNYLVLFLVSDNMIFKVLMQGAFSNSVFGYSWIAILCCGTYSSMSACLITHRLWAPITFKTVELLYNVLNPDVVLHRSFNVLRGNYALARAAKPAINH